MENLNKICPNCSQIYSIKSQSPLKGNLPLFLSCGHSMCESCVKNIVKFSEPIECKVCHQDMEISPGDLSLLVQNKLELHQIFPINVYTLGELILQNDSKDLKQSEDYFIDIKAIIKSVEPNKGNCIECQNETPKMCKQCNMILCDTCFNKTHKNFIVFKNHSLQLIEATTEDFCKQHTTKTLEYYCNKCAKSICMDCMMVGGEKSCKNHDVVSMQEVNDGFLNEIADIAPKVNETFKRFTKTAVDIGTLLNNIDNETSSSEHTQIIADIEQSFSKLVSVIQKHKNDVISRVTKLKHAEKESLVDAKTKLAESIKKSKNVVNMLNAAIEGSKTNQMNLSDLLEDAKRVIESPWYLCKEAEIKEEPLKVTVNEDLFAVLGDYVTLEGNTNSLYKLKSSSEFKEGEEIPAPPANVVYPPELPKDVRQMNKKKADPIATNPPAFYKEAPKYRSKHGSNSSLNSISSDASYKNRVTNNYNTKLVHPVPPFPESNQPKPFREGSTEVIYISHIVDPHNFYVQRSCHQGLVKEMFREFRNAKSLPKPSSNHVAEGKLYLGFNKVDDMWQRCRVVSTEREDINNAKFQIFYIDFGSHDTVNIDSLRLLTPAKQSLPPLAVNCALANCVPRAGAWTTDDAFLIQNIIANKQAVIHIRHIRSTSNYNVTLECDLTTVEDGVSLAHALVFHERARMPKPNLPYPKTGFVEKPRIFINNNDFKYKSVEEVCITQVVSPDKFFVRKQHLNSVYEKLCEDMEMEYGMNPKASSIYLPEIGMAVAVDLTKYQMQLGEGVGDGGEECVWARGVVHETPGRGRVRVLLPDRGALLLVHCAALRRLRTDHLKLQALATECHLAGVTPLNKKWNPASVALLQKFQQKILELHVEDTRNRNSVGVTLYDKTDVDNIVCVNSEMIKHKYAITFGLYIFNQKYSVEDQVHTNKSPPQAQKPKPEEKPKKIKILKKETPSPADVKSSDLEAKDKGPLRLEAKILNCQSPSLIYVSLIHQQKVFNELFENLQNYYTKKKSQKKENWKAGDRCCSLCIQSQTWRRAVILELEKDNAKVFYSDFAIIEAVPLSELRELTTEFAQIGDAAIKCHLSGVLPAVGEEWPSLTKEYLAELIESYKRFFITKVGNFKNDSMPIELWVYHTIPGGALEPNISEWRCLNNMIVQQGLGVPDRSQEVSNPSTAPEESDEILSFLNITGSVSDWLQLEPMPTKPLLKPSSDSQGPPTILDEDEAPSDEPSTSNTVFISNWLPPEPLQSKEFSAMPTYIDNYGIIYLHELSQQSTLDLIRKALDVRFKGPDVKAKFSKWSVGEPCVALYFLDNAFYRGQVVAVNKEASTCLVHYIDYGNEEVCSFENMRKSIALYQIPIQAHKCVLNRIRPVGEKSWDRTVLDYVHKSIVEKECLVKITGEAVDGVIPIDIKYDKLCINDHLVDFEMAEYTDGTKPVIRKYAPCSDAPAEEVCVESDSGPDYVVEDDLQSASSNHDTDNELEYLESKDWNKIIEEEENKHKFITYPTFTEQKFQCNIALVNDVKVLQLSIVQSENLAAQYQKMFDALQSQGDKRPDIDGVFLNKACIAIFPEDGLWYRASILEHSEVKGLVKVCYIDYGNIEVVPISDVREISKEWAKLPPGTISAKLHGIEISPDIDLKNITDAYAKTFLDKGPFNAEILGVDDNSIPYVELKDDHGDLVYKKLIESGVFIKYE